jgi:hypothetical protein
MALNKTTVSFLLAIGWLLLSTFLLLLPGNRFPQENWFDRIWVDKWVHIGMFAVMVILWCRALKTSNAGNRHLLKIFIFLTTGWFIYGIGMEFVQRYLVANRSFDTGDIIADGIGCAAGLFYSVRQYIKK